MADQEPEAEVAAGSVEPISWPDPSRPIVNEQPWGGYPQQAAPAGQPTYTGGPYGYQPSAPPRRRMWTVLVVTLVILAALLVSVWLLWWR